MINLSNPTFAAMTDVKKFIKDSLHTGVVRGRDSTGIFGINRDDVLLSHKKAVEGSVFHDLYHTNKILGDLEKMKCLIVHHRKATQGSVIDRNAHPFTVGPITLVHNGTVSNFRTLEYEGTYTVDSEAICAAIAEAKDPKDVLKELYGAYVLIWLDSRDNTLHIAKNNERPLHGIVNKASKSLLFASESGMLSWLADRNNVTYKKMTTFDNLMHYKWDMSGDCCTKFTKTKFEEKTYKSQSTTVILEGGHTRDNWANVYNRNSAYDGGITTSVKLLEQLGLKKNAVIPFTGYSVDPHKNNDKLGICHGAAPDLAYLVECIAFPVPSFKSSDVYYGRILYAEDDMSSGYVMVNVQFMRRRAARNAMTRQGDNPGIITNIKRELKNGGASPMVKGPGGEYISLSYYNSRITDGCTTCGDPLESPDDVLWDYSERPYCCLTCKQKAAQVISGV